MWPDSRSILLRSQSADFGLIFSFLKQKQRFGGGRLHQKTSNNHLPPFALLHIVVLCFFIFFQLQYLSV